MLSSKTARWTKPALLLVPSLLVTVASAQYSAPESVEYDPAGDRYFVSNTGSQLIRSRDQAGVVTTLADVGDAPYGLELLGDTLFACVGGSLKGYSAASGALVFDLDLGGNFLNGITTDGTFVYVTDFTASRIYKVDPAAGTSAVLVGNTNGTPNGIVWDPVGARLVVVFWGGNAPIKAFDPETGAAQTLVQSTGLTNLDGITIDCAGNFLVASWSPDRITRFEPSFTQPGVNLGIVGLNNPADIDMDLVNDRVCIPNGPTNTVILAQVDCSTGLDERPASTTKVIPNPTAGLVRFDAVSSSPEPYMVIDARGAVQASGLTGENGVVDLSGLSAGPYTVVLTRLGLRSQVVRR